MDARFHICLIIDDNPLDNFINSMIMQLTNFADEIIAKESSQDALKLLREGGVKPDVIFLDIRMPEMDGFQFLSEYEKIDIDKNQTKIFMLSSSIDPLDLAKAKTNKLITGYFVKSLTPDILEAIAR